MAAVIGARERSDMNEVCTSQGILTVKSQKMNNSHMITALFEVQMQ